MSIYKSANALMFVTFILPAFAQTAEAGRREPLERFRKSGEAPPAQGPELVMYDGEVHCSDHEKSDGGADHGHCDLEFKSSEGKTFDLKADAELSAAVCAKHDRHLKVQITAEREPRFLFWGGDLKVVQYKVLGEMPESYCAAYHEGDSLKGLPETKRSKKKI